MSTRKAIIIILAAIAASVLIVESGVLSLKLDGSGGSGSSAGYNDIDAKTVKGDLSLRPGRDTGCQY